ncbi:NfeD family protein [Roseateles koreensis]|uniref:NfeD family protein n=1 Tax=Roseateles koreensis TaxID=2987526 RepID=A0ABT5KQK5_9BURK|nr:NfeD family protein [Roseateles koreensis]MDC8785201.1 NfeD family protein [Roseateles koreensis]
MEMSLASLATAWWIAAGILVAVELTTGTFYLLMLAIGCSAGALSAHLGLSPSLQMSMAALIGGVAVVLWHRRRDRLGSPLPANANPDVQMDVGQTVHVSHWRADGTAQVRYRGAEWQVRYQGVGNPESGPYVIRAIEGSRLLLDH